MPDHTKRSPRTHTPESSVDEARLLREANLARTVTACADDYTTTHPTCRATERERALREAS